MILPVEKAFFEGTNWNGSGLGGWKAQRCEGQEVLLLHIATIIFISFFLLLNFDALERSRLNKCIVAGLRRSDRK